MKIIQPEVTIQQEVVEIPRWVTAAQYALGQHRYLSQEKKIWAWDFNFGEIAEGDFSFLEMNYETKKLWVPMSERNWNRWKKQDMIAGTTCRYCPDPITDGYQMMFPTRCKDCGTLNSYRQRGRNTARKLLSIKYALNLESVLWTFTFPIVESNRPLEQDEIDAIAKERRRYISKRLFQDKEIWHEKFVGINVMECVVTEPGEKRPARWYYDDYERTSNCWTYHIHGHYLILNQRGSKVNLEKAYAKFGKNVDEATVSSELPSGSCTADNKIKMRLSYKHERDYDQNYYNTEGEVVGTRDEMKIMRDYLVGYARKDCLGKYAWVGDRTWRKVRTKIGDRFTTGELEAHNPFNGSGYCKQWEKQIEYIGGNEYSPWVQLGLEEQII